MSSSPVSTPSNSMQSPTTPPSHSTDNHNSISSTSTSPSAYSNNHNTPKSKSSRPNVNNKSKSNNHNNSNHNNNTFSSSKLPYRSKLNHSHHYHNNNNNNNNNHHRHGHNHNHNHGAPPSNCIVLKNLDYSMTRDTLSEVVTRVIERHNGHFKSLTLVEDKSTRAFRGVAFVTFASVREASIALGEMSNVVINGRKVVSEYRRTRSAMTKKSNNNNNSATSSIITNTEHDVNNVDADTFGCSPNSADGIVEEDQNDCAIGGGHADGYEEQGDANYGVDGNGNVDADYEQNGNGPTTTMTATTAATAATTTATSISNATVTSPINTCSTSTTPTMDTVIGDAEDTVIDKRAQFFADRDNDKKEQKLLSRRRRDKQLMMRDRDRVKEAEFRQLLVQYAKGAIRVSDILPPEKDNDGSRTGDSTKSTFANVQEDEELGTEMSRRAEGVHKGGSVTHDDENNCINSDNQEVIRSSVQNDESNNVTDNDIESGRVDGGVGDENSGNNIDTALSASTRMTDVNNESKDNAVCDEKTTGEKDDIETSNHDATAVDYGVNKNGDGGDANISTITKTGDSINDNGSNTHATGNNDVDSNYYDQEVQDMIFDATLTSYERRMVHAICEELNLGHISRFDANGNRILRVTRDPVRAAEWARETEAENEATEEAAEVAVAAAAAARTTPPPTTTTNTIASNNTNSSSISNSRPLRKFNFFRRRGVEGSEGILPPSYKVYTPKRQPTGPPQEGDVRGFDSRIKFHGITDVNNNNDNNNNLNNNQKKGGGRNNNNKNGGGGNKSKGGMNGFGGGKGAENRPKSSNANLKGETNNGKGGGKSNGKGKKNNNNASRRHQSTLNPSLPSFSPMNGGEYSGI